MNEVLISAGLPLADSVLGIDVQMLIYLVLIIASVIGGIIQKTRGQKDQPAGAENGKGETAPGREMPRELPPDARPGSRGVPDPQRVRPTGRGMPAPPGSGESSIPDLLRRQPIPTRPPGPGPVARPVPPEPVPRGRRGEPVARRVPAGEVRPGPVRQGPTERRQGGRRPEPRPRTLTQVPSERLSAPIGASEEDAYVADWRRRGQATTPSPAPGSAAHRPGVGQRVEQMLRERESQAVAIVLQEILGPPVALREPREF